MNDQNATKPGAPRTDTNKDPITGSHGAHPVGVGLGAVGTGLAAGAVGAVIAGPVGAVAGAVGGAVVGGLAGKAAAEAVNPTIESKYWRDTYASRPYFSAESRYEEYAPAYQYGWESYGRRGTDGRSFESVEADLGRDWDKAKGTSHLAWDKAKDATRDAWDRVRTAARGPATPSAR